MATVTITTDSTKDARIADAFDAEFPGRTEAGATKAQWIKQQLIVFMRQTVKNYEANKQAALDRQTVSNDIDNFTIS